MLKPYYVIVTGGRNYKDARRVGVVLNEVRLMTPSGHELVIVQGDAQGADELAKRWAAGMKLPYFCFPAKWAEHGLGAGHIRNKQMLEALPIQLVVAFPGGAGTNGMIELACLAGVRVLRDDDLVANE
jgi:hypothetical protein